MRPRSVLLCLAILLLAACGSTSAAPGGTPGAGPARGDVLTYRGDDARNGVMPGPGPNGSPVVRWTFAAGSPIGTQVAVSGGTVFLVATDGTVHALDLATGAGRWSATTGTETHASPSIADGVVIVGANDGVHAFAVADGHSAWTSPATGVVRGCPAIDGHTAVFASAGGTATALDTRTGVVLWTHSLGAPDNSSVATVGGLAVLGLENGIVVALALADGTERWRADTGTGARIGTVAIADGRVFVPTLDDGGPGSRTITTLDLATGRRLWSFASPGDKPAYAPAVGGGRAIVEGEDGSVTALDSATGAVLWQSKAPGLVEVVAAVADGVSYGASNGGFVFALDAATGAERWRVPIRGVPYGAVVTSGLVLVGTSMGTLYAIGGSVP